MSQLLATLAAHAARLKRLLTLDQRVIYALLFRGSQAVVGVVTILVITLIFSPQEQGYYYTFGSILALQIIFEMGLSFIILQFTGHEFATLSWSKENQLQGPPDKIAEFNLFLAKCFIAYGLIGLAIFCIVWPAGTLFFANAIDANHTLTWGFPWFWLCLSTAFNILTLPFLCVIEGSGLIVKINQFKTIQNTAGAIVMWLAMISGAELYSIALDPFICFLITVCWLKFYYPDLLHHTVAGLRQLCRKSTALSPQPAPSLQWMRDVWPMQWRIAISWISGYFLSQIYTPIIFYYHDAIAAGKLGVSMTVCNMLSLFAITFLNAHNPEMCQLIANKQWDDLYQLFMRVALHAFLLAGLVAAIIFIATFIPLLDFITTRFVSPFELLLLLIGTLIQYIIGAIALLLRAFKREPFVWVSLMGAILNAGFAWWFGRLYGTIGIATTYLLLNILFGLPTAWLLWRKHTMHLWTRKPDHAFN